MKSLRRITVNSFATLAAYSIVGGLGTLGAAVDAAPANAPQQTQETSANTTPGAPLQLDRSGRKQVGKASFYASRYSGKTMADGTPMRLYSNNAASLTLPLGTTAKVTNLQTGQSAIVTIRDRGPYVKGRIVDLSPATARKIGITRNQGLAKVEVAPIAIPLADGSVRIASLATP
jgi:rare lipoprotein A